MQRDPGETNVREMTTGPLSGVASFWLQKMKLGPDIANRLASQISVRPVQQPLKLACSVPVMRLSFPGSSHPVVRHCYLLLNARYIKRRRGNLKRCLILLDRPPEIVMGEVLLRFPHQGKKLAHRRP